MKKAPLLLFSFLFLIYRAEAQTEEPHTHTQKNVILIVIDDLNDYLEPYYGQPQVKSPNIKKIASQGTLFINNFCNAPQCTPSRFSMITGKDVSYTQVYNNGVVKCQNFRSNFTPEKGNAEVYTFPEVLKDHGYFTYNISKIMPCHDSYADYDSITPDPCAKNLSWSRYDLLTGGPEFEDVFDIGASLNLGVNGYAYAKVDDSLETHMLDYVAADSAISFLDHYAVDPSLYCGRPFLLAVGFRRPHAPNYIPAKYYLPYYTPALDVLSLSHLPYNNPPDTFPYNGLVMPPQPDPKWSDFYALPDDWIGKILIETEFIHQHYQDYIQTLNDEGLLPLLSADLTDSARMDICGEAWRANGVLSYIAANRFVDAMVGRIYNDLKSHKQIMKNTVLIITSDNGYSLGEKAHWKKSTMYETDLRVPLIIVDFSHPHGNICNRTVSLLDLFPTIMDFTGTPYPNFADGSNYLDGYSLRPLVLHPAMSWNRPVLSTFKNNVHDSDDGYCFRQFSVRDEEWHYIRYQNNGSDLGCYPPTSVIQEELFHIGLNREIDPNEWNNLAGDTAYSDVKNYLASFLPDSVNYLQMLRSPAPVVQAAEDPGISLQIAPNPASDFLLLSLVATPGPAQLQVFDMMGNTVLTRSFDVSTDHYGEFMLETSHLSPGYYILRVMQDGESAHASFIKI